MTETKRHACLCQRALSNLMQQEAGQAAGRIAVYPRQIDYRKTNPDQINGRGLHLLKYCPSKYLAI